MDPITLQQMKEIKVAKMKCLKSLLFHTRYFFKKQYNRKFVVGRHHEIIAEALEKVLRGEIKRLIINIAPRYGKTELAVKNFIAAGLALNPAAKFIHLSYSDTLALDNSESVKDAIQSDEYRKLFPEVKVKKDSKAKDKWYTTAGGGVLARAAGGGVTGFGAGLVDDPDAEGKVDKEMEEFFPDVADKTRFGGAIIIDDPIKPEDADQDTIREKVNSRFDSTIRNRANSRDTPIVVIMQRLHPMDLAGYLQRDAEEDEWTVISLPCIQLSETGEREALWPFKHTLDELDSLKRSNDIVFERQYNQNPKPKAGLLFPIDDLHFYEPLDMLDSIDNAEFSYLCADPANEGGDDFAALAIKLIGNRLYVNEVIYNTDGTDVNEPAVARLILQENATSVGIEGVMGWRETVDRIRAELDKKNYGGEIRTLKPRTAKHTRILNRSSFIRNNFYFRKDYLQYPQYEKFMQNLTSYKRIQAPGAMNKRDDAPDVCEMGASYFERNFKHIVWGT